ncbi:MAG: YidC/Oxa1 family insertase periplasmic-domain containing protein, partial [Flavobacteriales bacterium]|nr:YidC/Oxa1 family insertase periplasmic-domain containing protein [Flavobacteriales bacterium]
MDKNSLTGVILIVLIVVGYNAMFPPVVETETPKEENNTTVVLEEKEEVIEQNSTSLSLDTALVNETHERSFGVFAPSATGSEDAITIENEKLLLSISPKGGRIISAILKDYQRSDSLPLNLIDKDSSDFNITFFSEGNRIINTEDLYFQAANQSDQSVSMRLMASNGGYLEYVYNLSNEDFMMDFQINTIDLEDIIPSNRNELELNWTINLPHTEKSM